MKIKTKDLLDILNHFKFIFNDNNYIEDAKYIFFNTKENVIWCYTDVMAYHYKYDGNLAEDFDIIDEEIALPAKELFNLIKKIKKEEITAKQDDNAFTIRNGKSLNTFSLPNITSDKKKMLGKDSEMEDFPDISPFFKQYVKYDKSDVKHGNIIFENGEMIASDRYNITKMGITEEFDAPFAVEGETLKHIISNGFTKCGVSDDILFFGKDNYTLVCNNNMKNAFAYKDLFSNATEELDYNYSIYVNKEENIDFIDTFLLNYKNLDKKVEVSIINESRMLVVANNQDKTQETRASINIDKYSAGEKDKFKISIEYFKSVYINFDYFNIMYNMLYCYNVEHGIELIVSIGNL